MFAIIEDGSRQYRVQPGEMLTVDYRSDAKKGDTFTFDRVLLANAGGASAIGRPLIEGATVDAEVIVPRENGPKLEIQKIRRRKNSRRHTGHRQKHTAVRITAINVPGLEVVEPPETESVPPPTAEATTTAETKPAEESAVAEESSTDETTADSAAESAETDE